MTYKEESLLETLYREQDRFEFYVLGKFDLQIVISIMEKFKKIEEIIGRNHVCKDCEVDSIHCRDDCLIQDLQDISDVIDS